MLTMRPARAASIGPSAACVHRNTPVRLTASMRSQVACGRRASGPVSTAPALLTSACSAPPLACTSANARATLAASVTSSSTQSCTSPFGDGQRDAHLLERRARAPRERHVPARARERLRDGRADAARGAGDEHAPRRRMQRQRQCGFGSQLGGQVERPGGQLDRADGVDRLAQVAVADLGGHDVLPAARSRWKIASSCGLADR